MTVLRSFLLTILFVLASSCVDNMENSQLKHGESHDGEDPDPVLPAPVLDPTSLTYFKDVKPILAKNCEGCHTEGGIAPFALTDLALVQRYKKGIRSAVVTRRMPPWSADPGHQTYRGDLSLSDSDIATISGWIDAGTKPGDESDYIPLPQATFTADLTLPILPAGSSYTPNQWGGDDYRCFIIPVPATVAEKPWLIGFESIPGNPKLVHHLVAHTASAEIVPTLQKLDAAEAGLGYQCIGGSLPDRLGRLDVQEELEAENPGIVEKLMNGTHWLAQWAPGMGGVMLPDGLGLKLESTGAIVVQVHYYSGDAKGEADSGTRIGLRLAKEVEKPAFYYPFTNRDWLFSIFTRAMVIPPESEASFEVDTSLDSIATYGRRSIGLTENEIAAVEMHGAQLHMHTRGMSGIITMANAGSPSETLLSISNWDFHWQRDYHFLQPKVVNVGDLDQWTRKLSCSYYNPETHAIYGGLGSNDEMCYDFALFAFDLNK